MDRPPPPAPAGPPRPPVAPPARPAPPPRAPGPPVQRGPAGRPPPGPGLAGPRTERRFRPPTLEQILAHKSREVALRRAQRPIRALQETIREMAPCRDFLGALRAGAKPRLIAEVKKSSPSAGVIREPFVPVAISRAYERAGAAAVSVLTDDRYFGGDLVFLKAIKRAQGLPCLLKDFVLEPYQVYEGRVYGADAVLLIARILEDAALRELRSLAESLGMAALVEVHDEADLERALRASPSLVGVNNRNLATLETDLTTTARLRPKIPEGVLCVSESGYRERAEVEAARSLGVDALLIGETFLRVRDIEGKVRDLFAVRPAPAPAPAAPPPAPPPTAEEEAGLGPLGEDEMPDLPDLPDPVEPIEPPGP